MDIGVFIPIGNNGWLISTASPQYLPTFVLNREIVQKAERYGLDLALSMIQAAWLWRQERAELHRLGLLRLHRSW
jgi:hypothetical protein